MITVKIDEETLLDMLMQRVEYWRERDTTDYALFYDYYKRMVYNDYFDGIELDINVIVDNDIVNNTRIIYEDESEYNEVKKIYDEQGFGDCSCETKVCDFIEAYDEKSGAMLVI